MINLSYTARGCNGMPLAKRIHLLRDPDIYFAQDVQDFKKNASSLKFPLHKRRFPFFIDSIDRAWVIIPGVKVEPLLGSYLDVKISDCSDDICMHASEGVQENLHKNFDWYDVVVEYSMARKQTKFFSSTVRDAKAREAHFDIRRDVMKCIEGFYPDLSGYINGKMHF